MPFITPTVGGLEIPPFLLDHWRNLALTTGQADPVCCAPVWNLAYRETACPESRLFYLADDSSLIIFRADEIGRPGLPCLYPVEGGWLFPNPLLGDKSPSLLLEALNLMIKEYGRLPALVLSGIQPRTILRDRILLALSNFYDIFLHAKSAQCSASLEGGLDGWLGRRSANHRAKLRKARKKAAELGLTFERRRPRARGEASGIYARMLAVEEKSWKGIERCGMAERPARQFYDELIGRLAQEGSAYVIFARSADQDIGFIFGGAAGKIYRGQQFSFDDAYRAYSLGNLMQLEKIAWLCELGFERYDMGPITGPRMGYKEHWTETRSPMESWALRPKE